MFAPLGRRVLELVSLYFPMTNNFIVDSIIIAVILPIAFTIAFWSVGKLAAVFCYDSAAMSLAHWSFRIFIVIVLMKQVSNFIVYVNQFIIIWILLLPLKFQYKEQEAVHLVQKIEKYLKRL